MEQNNNNTFLSKIYETFVSFIVDLPFKNYKEYYKTGIIQKMNNEEKIKFMIELNNERQHRHFFKYFINLRPSILDEDDCWEYKESMNNIKQYNYAIFSGFFLNWSYFTFNFFIRKRYVYKPLIIINGLLFLVYLRVNSVENRMMDNLFNKYKHVIKREDVIKIIKESYRFDKDI